MPFPILLSIALALLVLVGMVLGVTLGLLANEFARVFLRGLALSSSAFPKVHSGPGSSGDSIVVGCGELGGAAVVLLFLPYVAQKPLRALGYIAPSIGAIGVAVVAATADMIVTLGYGFARSAFHQSPHVQAGFASYRFGSTTDAILGAFTLCVVAPFAEETIFRGFLFNALAARMRLPFAYLIAATAFAAIHLDIVIAPALVVSGLILTFVYRRTGSIYASMITHGIGNAVFAIPYILDMHTRHAH
jgi:membrane protease YdiL (CAAX protease family)